MATHGKKLTDLLYRMNMPQTELAEILGKSRQTVNGYMTKEKLPFEVIQKVIKHFNLDEEYFDLPDNKEDYVKIEDYKRLQNVTSYQEKLIQSLESQLSRVEEELQEYKTKGNRQTG